MSALRKIKVLHLLEWLDISGGLERVALEITGGLDKEAYEAEIWCVHRGGKLVEVAEKMQIPVRILNIASYYNPLNILKLAKAFREASPDIIHTHVYFASTIGRIAATIAGVPVCINHVHSTYWHYTSKNLFIERLLSRVTDKIVCVSGNVRDFVINQEKIDPSKVEVIYNGISSVKALPRKEARKNLDVAAEEEVIIISVATLSENKGHKVLLKALSLLAGRFNNFKCWIIGEGPMEKELKELAEELNLDPKVVFWGVRTDVSQLLAAGDIFVLASIQREGMPISVLEAMSCQVPVIASRIGGLAEIIDDGKNGLLVPPGDPAYLAKAIEGLIMDKDLRLHYAKEALIKFKEHFDVKWMITRIDNLYQECLKNHA